MKITNGKFKQNILISNKEYRSTFVSPIRWRGFWTLKKNHVSQIYSRVV